MDRKKLNLSNYWIETLINLPETGMGYQLVDIKLNDGTILRRRVVVNSSYLMLEEGEYFKVSDIEDIKLSQ